MVKLERKINKNLSLVLCTQGSSVNWILRDSSYVKAIFCDINFQNSCKVLEEKVLLLCQGSMGKNQMLPNH